MYGLPSNFDASIFVEHELEQICFSATNVTLHFGDGVSISVLSAVAYSLSSTDPRQVESVPVSYSGLMRLIGKRVLSAESEVDGHVILRFSGGAELHLRDDSTNYESYSIRVGNREIIV